LEAKQKGKLYLVSTPIGNLKDITFRAVEVLSTVDLIAAEDTRHAAILLNHYDIKTPTTSFFDFNKEKKTPTLIKKIVQGQSIAVISDAGTPGISDPAFYIVRQAIKEGISIEAIPGATAFIPACIAIARELTKKFEQLYRGTLEDICKHPDVLMFKGEFVIVIQGKG